MRDLQQRHFDSGKMESLLRSLLFTACCVANLGQIGSVNVPEESEDGYKVEGKVIVQGAAKNSGKKWQVGVLFLCAYFIGRSFWTLVYHV